MRTLFQSRSINQKEAGRFTGKTSEKPVTYVWIHMRNRRNKQYINKTPVGATLCAGKAGEGLFREEKVKRRRAQGGCLGTKSR